MSWHFRKRPFWQRVYGLTEQHGDCLFFTGHRDEFGYGRIRGDDGKLIRLHRAVWAYENGPIPPKMVIMHTCDNTACIEKKHLKLGTQKENMRDRENKDRGNRMHTFDVVW